MFVQDTLTNLVTGMGTQRDKLSFGRFTSKYLDRGELTALYESDWLAGKIIDAPCDDMTREWRVWSGGPKQVAALQAAERSLNLQQQVNRALKMSRLSGGSVLLVVTNDPDQMQPLNIDAIPKGGIRFVHALSRWDIVAGPIDRDMLSPLFGTPAFYTLYSAGGTSAQIHPSRVVRFLAQRRLDETTQIEGWGISSLQRVYDAVRNATVVADSLASLTQEAKVDIIKIPGLNQFAIDPTYRNNILARFSLANLSKSTNNAVLLDAAEEWSQKQVSFASQSDVLDAFLHIAAAAADIPATRLLSKSAKGLNNGGEADTRNYYDMLSSKQEIEIRPVLAPLDEMLIRHATGARPANVGYTWTPLWQIKESERAAIELQSAQTDQILAVIGGLPPSAMRTAIRGRLLASNVYPGLSDALAQADAAGEVPAPLLAASDVVETNSPKSAPAKS